MPSWLFWTARVLLILVSLLILWGGAIRPMPDALLSIVIGGALLAWQVVRIKQRRQGRP